MIDPDTVTHPEQVLHPVHPPREILPFDLFPPVYRISPQLPGLTEVVGRHPGNSSRSPVLIEPEQVLVGPDIRTVIRRVEREVPDDTDTEFFCMFVKSIPLGEGDVLDVLLFFNGRTEYFFLRLQYGGCPVPDTLRPGRPVSTPCTCNGRKQGIVRKPVPVPGPEELKTGIVPAVLVQPCCRPEELSFLQRFPKKSVTRCFRFREVCQLEGAGDPVLHHKLRADKEGIESKKRGGVVG